MKKNLIFFMPSIEKGGIEKNLIILSNNLSQKFNIKIVCSEINNEIKKKIKSKVKIIIATKYISTRLIPLKILNTINSFIEIFKNKKKIVNVNSLLLSFQNHPFPIVLAKVFKIKIILRIANHPYSSLRYFNNFFLFGIKIFIKLFFYRFADGIICNSNSSRLFLKKYVRNNSITTIFNPVLFNTNLKSKKVRKNLLTVGRLENQKNISGIIDAIKIVRNKYPDIKLIIIGSGSQKLILEKKIRDNNLNNNVLLKGYIDPKKYLTTSKILILNSYFEGMPNILLEGLQNKIPIISTDCESGPKEILKNQQYGYLTDINNSYNLSKKIIFVIKNYKYAISKANKGYDSLLRFNLKNQLLKYESYITKINFS